MEAGAGDQTLVFLPGTLGTVNIFHKQVSAFSPTCRVIVLGYPGVSDMSLMTGSFFGVLEQLKLNSAHFIGSSLGAYWLQIFTQQRADFLESLILGNTFCNSHRLRFIKIFQPDFLNDSSEDQVKKAWLQFIDRLATSELKNFLRNDVCDHQSSNELYGRSLAVAHGGLVGRSLLSDDKIALLSCDDDPVVQEESIKDLKCMYANSHHFRFNTGGHYPHVLNTPAYNNVIQRHCVVHLNGATNTMSL